MPALDSCHEHVVRALAKAGWSVEASPYQLSTEVRTGFVDIQAQHRGNGTRQQILLIEVKCFPDRTSTTRDLYTAIGQYLVYQAMIEELDLGTPLLLALPSDAYATIFDTLVQKVVRSAQIKLVVVDLEREEVTQWIW